MRININIRKLSQKNIIFQKKSIKVLLVKGKGCSFVLITITPEPELEGSLHYLEKDVLKKSSWDEINCIGSIPGFPKGRVQLNKPKTPMVQFYRFSGHLS